MKLLIVTPPYSGHLNPLLVIAQHLRCRGVDSTFVTGPAKLPACLDLGFDAVPVLPEDPAAMERIANTARISGHPLRALRQVRNNFRLLPRALVDVQAAADRLRPDAIVGDFCAPVAGLVAGRLGVPWITTMPTPFAIENRLGTPAYCGGWAPGPGLLPKLRDGIGRGLTRGSKHLAGALFGSELASFGGGLYRADGSEVFYSDQAILALGLAELEFDRDWPDVLRFIGPITADPTLSSNATEPAAAADLDLRRRPDEPRVLVTLGTHLTWAKTHLVARVLELAERLPGHRFVVALGDADRRTRPRRAAERVQVVPWVPYDRTLGGFDAVIHHGGAGITYSTLRAGRPSLVWPHDYDQFDFAARIVRQGLGVRIRRLADAEAGLPRALDLPREPLDRFAERLRDSDPVGQVEQVLTDLVARSRRAAG